MYFLKQTDTFLIKDIAKLFGFIMDGLFEFTKLFGVQNIGLSIILFTFVTKLLMMPLTIKQQKFAKVSSLMNPELQALMNKYRDKRDEKSMLKMREEQKAIYEKYGTTQSSGCLQLLIQFPIIFALYDVIRNIPFYVNSVGVHFERIIDGGLSKNLDVVKEYVDAEKKAPLAFKNLASAKNNSDIMDALNQFDTSHWDKLSELFEKSNANLSNIIAENSDKILEMNDFFGLNLADAPKIASAAIIIPILAGFTQWLSMKLSQSKQEKRQGKVKEPENNYMSTMNTIMPVMSAVFCLTFPSGIGIYWIAQSVTQILTQLVVNSYFDKQDVNEMIAKNIEKANKKRAKQGLPPKNISANAHTNVSKVQNYKEVETKTNNDKKLEDIKKATDYYKDDKKGSIAARAAMVQKYNEKNKK